MKSRRIPIVALAVLAAAFAELALAGEQQYLIVAAGNQLPDGLSAAVTNAGGKITGKIPQIGVAVAVSGQTDFQEKARAIAEVQAVIPDEIIQAAQPDAAAAADLDDLHVAAATGALANLQWGLQAVQAPAAWTLGVTGKGARVAVIDTGILTAHPDLTQNLNLELSASFVPGETVEFIPSAANANFSHATHVAGIIAAADDGFGTVGVAPDAELIAIKVFSDIEGSGRTSGLIAAILYAADLDADVVNLSLGSRRFKSTLDSQFMGTVWNRTLNYARQQGTLIVGAAGNEAIDGDHDRDGTIWPSDLPGVLSVSATGPIGWADDPDTNLDLPAFYTNYGQSAIDLAAPGGNADFTLVDDCTLEGITRQCWVFDMVLSTSSRPSGGSEFEPDGTWAFARGTSAAAPHVAAVAALAVEARGGPISAERLAEILKVSADDLGKPGKDDFYGHGRVNAFNAVITAAFDE